MKKILIVFALLGCIAGCATPPMYMANNFQGKKITRCDNDTFCFRDAYSVAWDYSCPTNGYKYRSNCNSFWSDCGSEGYPVSYRSREYVYEKDPSGYAITLPGGGTVAMPQDKVKEVAGE
jgi:hypothetical protein